MPDKIEVITLEPFDFGDKYNLAKYANNVKIADHLRNSFPNPYTPEDAEKYIQAQQCKKVQTDFKILINGAFGGRIAVDVKDDIYCKSAEIGYWIAEPFWGKGIASEAITLIKSYAFKTFDLTRLFAICFENNTGSRKALERAGFVLESIRKNAVFKKGVVMNDCVYVFNI